MELECVESLGPDSSPTQTTSSSSPHDSLHPQKQLSTPTRSATENQSSQPQSHSQSHPQSLNCPDIINFPNNFLPIPLTHASSPLTRSPSPSPKRRRIAYNRTATTSRPLVPSPFTSAHPLTRLCHRDLRYVVKTPDHLADTPVTSTMREEVVAWCGDMITDLDLPEGIVAVATNIFDRFVAEQSVANKTILYALTASCLLLSCKLTLDDDVPQAEISSRAGVALVDIHLMEGVILNVLNWDVNVVTPHEVVHELNSISQDSITEKQRIIQDSLMLNALLDYSLSGMRATSVGVACYLLSCSVGTESVDMHYTNHFVYSLACQCGVNLAEVDLCAEKLRASMDLTFDGFEDVNSDEDAN